MQHISASLLRTKSLSRRLRRKVSREEIMEEAEEVLPNRPVKQTFVFAQTVRDDISIALPTRSRTHFEHSLIPQRNTWPTSTKERKPASYQFSEVPTLTRTPWELDRSRGRPHSQRSRTGTAMSKFSSHVFEQLPTEVYDCVLYWLEASYQSASVVAVDSLQRELRTLCLVSKRWATVTMASLYRDLWLPNPISRPKRKHQLTRPKSQLALLLRTLTDAPDLAFLVRRIHIPSTYDDPLQSWMGCTSAVLQLVEEVIGVCPELEKVTGFVPETRHDVARYHAKLLERPRMLEHVWLLDPTGLPVADMGRFIDGHNNWQCLETLILISAKPSDPDIGPGMLAAIIVRLGALKHLMVSGFSAASFHDGTLVSLPPLQSLRLERLKGVTSDGIEQLGLSRTAQSLRNLTLIDLELHSLRTIQILLARLPRLLKFRIQQNANPTLLTGTSITTKHTLLASYTLRYLHWDCLNPGISVSILAHSITASNFPSLRTIKAPCDYDGTLQALCRPVPHRPLALTERARLISSDQTSYTRSLQLSQLQAQRRVRESRAQPGFSVVIEDSDQGARQIHAIGGFLGDVRSGIEYCLEPDVEGIEGAVANWREIVRPGRVGKGERRVGSRVLF